MEHQVADSIKAQRSQVLIELGSQRQAAYAKSFVNKDVEVLFEEKIVENGKEYWQGHTRHYIRALAESGEDLTNVLKICKAEAVSEGGTIFCKFH